MQRFTRVVALAVASLLCAPSGAPADDTGLAQSLHGTVRIAGKVCVGGGHSHYGESGSLATRAKAEADAIRAWAEFTAFEYGTDWARFGNAAGKKVNCSQSAGSWVCKLDAIPCRGR